MGFLVEVLAAVLGEFIHEFLKTVFDPNREPPFVVRLLRRLLRWQTLVYILLILLILIISDLTPVRLGETVRVWALGLPKQEAMVSEALHAFDRGEFQNAIERSREVINTYEFSAKREQSDLDAHSASKWPEGKVRWGTISNSMDVFSRGSLNSVALAWWTIGRSEQSLGHPCEAKKAYAAASAYSYARTWDPQFWPLRGWSPFGFFWSPPDDAGERAQSLSCI